MISHTAVQEEQPNLRELFDQFKFHLIYRNKRKRTTPNNHEQLKSLFSQVQRDTRIKKQRKKALQKMVAFKSEKSVQKSGTLHSKIWQPPAIDLHSWEAVSQEIIVVEKQKQNLQQEISRLQTSLADIKKQVRSMRKSVELQSAKQQKFKHISYLTSSIQRGTDTNKIVNYRSYKKMIQYQDQTLAEMRRFKVGLRRQNQELENKLMQRDIRTPKSPKKTVYIKSQTAVREATNIKVDKSFMSRLQELIELFIRKQTEFDQIKSSQTTKVRLKKVQRNYLKQDRIKFQQMIDRFEQRYDVKIQSLANLILYLYKRLNIDNAEMESTCIKKNQIKMSLVQDLEDLKQKQTLILRDRVENVAEAPSQDSACKLKKICSNSSMLVNLVSALHNLIGKFKYLFTMALTLNMEKKHFQDLLIQISNVYRIDSIFFQKESDSNINTLAEQTTSFTQMKNILEQYTTAQSPIDSLEFLSFIFSDLRYTLIFRKGWLQDELQQGLVQGRLMQKLEQIQQTCNQIYDSKVKTYSHLLINSIKALSINKYERKMIALCNTGDHLFFAPHVKPISNRVATDNSDQATRLDNSQGNKYGLESTEQSPRQIKFSQNPRKIVQLLQKLKNEQKFTFQPTNFTTSQVYMYDGRVVLPKYAF